MHINHVKELLEKKDKAEEKYKFQSRITQQLEDKIDFLHKN